MMGVDSLLVLLALLGLKHLIFDFTPLQSPYQYLNKGIFGHPGGLLHSGLHIVGTFLVLSVFLFFTGYSLPLAAFILIYGGEFLVHYFTDLSKVVVTQHYGWGPLTHSQFWTAVGVDQYSHYLTYLLIGYIAAKTAT